VALDWDQLGQRVNEVHRAVAPHSMDKAEMAVPLVGNARYHAAAANVALELITNVEDPDRRRVLTELLMAPPDLLDWTALSLGTHSVVSALDLCAAAAWRLSVDQGPKGGKEKTLSDVFKNLRKQLKPGLREWLEGAYESDQYRMILEFRRWFTHKAVRRSATVFLGQDRAEYKSGVADYDEQSAIEHLRMAAPFAVEQFSAFCDVVIQEFK
jgi:hypothetical protein